MKQKIKNILVIDDDYSIRKLLSVTLRKMGYISELAKSGFEGLRVLKSGKKIDLILLDVDMPGMSGIDVLRLIRTSKKSFATTPVVMVTAHSERKTIVRVMNMGAQDFIVKPFDIGILLHKVSRWVSVQSEIVWSRLSHDQEQTLRMTLEMLDSIQRSMEEDQPLNYGAAVECGRMVTQVTEDNEVDGVLNALKIHDGYTFVHSMRTGIYLALFARALDFSLADTEIVAIGGILHDIGKAKTPLGILNKPGKLNPDEWVEMRAHVDHTVELLKKRPDVPDEIIEIAWCHHERMDGTGYPRGLRAEQTSELARMSAICDVYVALTDRRAYKPAWEPKQAFKALLIPEHFDQRLAEVFIHKVFRWSTLG